MKKRSTIAIPLTLFIVFYYASFAGAAIPRTINYQGVLTDAGGAAVVDGAYNITARLYAAASGGTSLWEETQTVGVVKSTFCVVLGAAVELDLPFDEQYYLGISVNGGGELAPRTALTALPYSMNSVNSGMLGGKPASQFADSVHAHDDLYHLKADLYTRDELYTRGELYTRSDLYTRDELYTKDDLFTRDELYTQEVLYRRDELNLAGTINDDLNPVDWTRLRNVPGDFADGVDNTGLTFTNALDAADGSPEDVVYVDDDGNAGVGTMSPGAKLDVNGAFIVTNESGFIGSRIFVHEEDAGVVNTYGPNGNLNCSISAYAGYENSGYISVCNSTGAKKAAVYVDGPTGQGVITADIKSFRVANPALAGTDICYACVEGPEAAAYIRGTARLAGGEASVEFPRHFVDVIVPGGMTVQLTPLSAESLGLAVVEKGVDRFVVRELGGGTGGYEFDYLVTAVRKGHESYEVIRQSLDTGDQR